MHDRTAILQKIRKKNIRYARVRMANEFVKDTEYSLYKNDSLQCIRIFIYTKILYYAPTSIISCGVLVQ